MSGVEVRFYPRLAKRSTAEPSLQVGRTVKPLTLRFRLYTPNSTTASVTRYTPANAHCARSRCLPRSVSQDRAE